MNIVIDGSTLSLLLYSHVNSSSNQMGFLLGYKAQDVQDHISDSQMHAEDTTCYIYVTSFVPWPDLKRFYYGNTESFNVKDIYDAGEGLNEEIIGWYSSRHQSSLRPSLKEVSTHHQLTTLNEFKTNDDFLFFLCTSSVSSNFSTHSSDHACLSYDSSVRKFKANSMTIKNLGDTSRSEYYKPGITHSHLAHDVADRSKKDFVKPTGEMDQVVKMKHLTESIWKDLLTLQGQVNKSEATVSCLEDEVCYLRKKMAHLETKDMCFTFKREQQRLQEEEAGNLRKESVREADEEKQVNKLLTDLGLSKDIASNLFQKSEEKTRRLSQDQDNLISWEKLEINPLYANTLNSTHVNTESQSNVADNNLISVSASCNVKESINNDVSSGSEKEMESVKNNLAPKVSNDPFDFIEALKSELNGPKAESSSKPRATVSIKSSAIHPSSSSKSTKESHKPEQGNSDVNGSRSLQGNSNSSNTSQMLIDDSMAAEDNTVTLSSSPMF